MVVQVLILLGVNVLLVIKTLQEMRITISPALATARTIAGNSFNGTVANISIDIGDLANVHVMQTPLNQDNYELRTYSLGVGQGAWEY